MFNPTGGGSADGGGFPDDDVGGLMARSATSVLDYDFLDYVCIYPNETTWLLTPCGLAPALNESQFTGQTTAGRMNLGRARESYNIKKKFNKDF